MHGEKYGRNCAIDLDNLLNHSLSDYSESKYLERTPGVKENIKVIGVMVSRVHLLYIKMLQLNCKCWYLCLSKQPFQ